MKVFLQKDSFGNWNAVPLVAANDIGHVNCHKFILHMIGKISWEEMISNAQKQKEAGTDFTFGEMARSISNIPFILVRDLDSLIALSNESCAIGKVYVGQILDAQTEEMAHSFIIERKSENEYVCFDKPGFKYQFSVHDLESILNFTNKDGEKSNRNQKWRFVPINNL